MLALMAVVSASAETLSITVDIDNADAVSMTLDGRQPLEYTNGANTFELDYYSGIQIKPNAGFGISKIVNQHGTPITESYGVYWIQGMNVSNGDVYTITTLDLATAEKAPFSINLIGDPSLVDLSFSGSNRRETLSEGENSLDYVVGYENKLYIAKSDYGKPIYSMKVNGTSYGSKSNYEVTLEPNMEIEIETTFPDIPCTYNITYTDVENVITAVRIGYTKLEDFDGRTFTCQAGDDITLNTNSEYYIEKVTLDGKELTASWGSYSFTAEGDGELVVSARPYGELNFVVNVNEAAGIKLYAGYTYNGEQYTLVDGRNELALSERTTYISFEANKAGGYYIESITDKDGNELSTTNSTIYDVAEGSEYTFTVGKHVLDQTAVVWGNDYELASYMTLQNSEYTTYPLSTGYNVIQFASSYNPFNFGFYPKDYSATNNYAFLNGEQCTPIYEGGSAFKIELADGDVLKAFVATDPVESEVTFVCDEGVSANIVRDIIVAVEDPMAGLTCFDGTQIDIKPIDGDGSLGGVKVNDEVVPADENGNYSFVVNGNTEVRLLGGTLGIGSVEAENAGNADVYNLQGIKVGTRQNLRALPAGLYIVGGEKVSVK